MKGFKYLFFTNKIKQPFYNFWFFKKLTAGEEDDSNLLTPPSNHSDSGVDWTWNKFNATGYGLLTKSGTATCDKTPLKETLVAGTTYVFSIDEECAYSLRITIFEGSKSNRQTISKGRTSVQFTSIYNATEFQINLIDQTGHGIDVTVKGFKLVKAE